MSILADICKADSMSSMKGCKNAYNSMCNQSSVIEMCTLYPALSHIPSTAVARNSVKGICTSHAMEPCSKLETKPCDYLGILIELCIEMPEMAQCSIIEQICTDEELKKVKGVCPANREDAGLPPLMRMYFHWGMEDYVLWRSWVPRNKTQYFFSCLAIILCGIIYEAIITLRSYLEAKWTNDAIHLYLRRQKVMVAGLTRQTDPLDSLNENTLDQEKNGWFKNMITVFMTNHQLLYTNIIQSFAVDEMRNSGFIMLSRFALE